MQKIQYIHAAESDWKLISCLNFPVNSHYFVSFIIKIIFSQILTLGAVRKANLQWIYRFLYCPSETQGFSPATWSVPKTHSGSADVHPVSAAGLCLKSSSPAPLCKSLHLKKPSRKAFHWNQPSNLAFSATAGFLWSHIPTRAFTWKAASLPHRCIYLKCLAILEQPLPWPPYPIFFPKSVGSF